MNSDVVLWFLHLSLTKMFYATAFELLYICDFLEINFAKRDKRSQKCVSTLKYFA